MTLEANADKVCTGSFEAVAEGRERTSRRKEQ